MSDTAENANGAYSSFPTRWETYLNDPSVPPHPRGGVVGLAAARAAVQLSIEGDCKRFGWPVRMWSATASPARGTRPMDRETIMCLSGDSARHQA